MTTFPIVISKLKQSEGIFNFAVYGTMHQEHYHALICGMAKSVDTLENEILSKNKSNFVSNIKYIQRNRKKIFSSCHTLQFRCLCWWIQM